MLYQIIKCSTWVHCDKHKKPSQWVQMGSLFTGSSCYDIRPVPFKTMTIVRGTSSHVEAIPPFPPLMQTHASLVVAFGESLPKAGSLIPSPSSWTNFSPGRRVSNFFQATFWMKRSPNHHWKYPSWRTPLVKVRRRLFITFHKVPLFVAFFRDFSMVKYFREKSFFQSKKQTPRFKSEISQGSFSGFSSVQKGIYLYIYI